MTDPLPFCIRAIVEREPTPELAVTRIQNVFPYWNHNAIHRGALTDRETHQDGDYQAKLDQIIKYTGEKEHG